jgi:hypothetical protein
MSVEVVTKWMAVWQMTSIFFRGKTVNYIAIVPNGHFYKGVLGRVGEGCFVAVLKVVDVGME